MAEYGRSSSSPSTKPCGNEYSLVPEIASRGVNGTPVKPASHGKMVEPKRVSTLKNNAYTSFKNTGLS